MSDSEKPETDPPVGSKREDIAEIADTVHLAKKALTRDDTATAERLLDVAEEQAQEFQQQQQEQQEQYFVDDDFFDDEGKN